ncbi:MAG: septum formation protein Maf [Lachnospiraceae bacterium]|nr:septum formation protein Maf [Lachnospiraceae bacterium]
MKNIILASQSPRRKELLAQAGFEFEIVTSDVEEVITDTKPEQIAESLSRQKACDVYNKIVKEKGMEYARNSIIIGADTIVAVDDKLLGKPKDKEDAADMLRLMSGRSHQVYTGVTLVVGDIESVDSTDEATQNYLSFNQCTEVEFYQISEQEIEEYLSREAGCKGQLGWEDKAGAYGIQGTVGAKFIKGIRGDYNNVVGLPIARLYQELKELL